MKRTILSIAILLALSLQGLCQLPKWRIKPTNDSIFIIEGTSMVRTDKNGATTLWNLDGEQLYTTDQKITKFYNGYSTVLKKDSREIIGVLDTAGHFTSFPHLNVAYNHPHFEDGYLVAKRKGKYTMMKKDGKEQELPDLHVLYPFSNGYAAYMAYENPEKMKKPYYNYITSDGTPLKAFIMKEKEKEKTIDPQNVKFISAVDKDGKAIAVVKNKLYTFNGADASLTPILGGNESEKKRHLSLVADKEQIYTETGNGNIILQAKYGKDETEEFTFDNQLRLLADGKAINYENKRDNKQTINIPTTIDTYRDDVLYGLIFDKNDSIPCQFEQVGVKYVNCAIVKSKGKWGIVEFTPGIQMSVTVNGDDTIVFRHKDFPTQLRIDFPTSILSKNVRVTPKEISGCNIDLDSRDHKDTREGNYVTYDCVLTAPSNLTDSVSLLTYSPLEMTCDNIKLHPMKIEFKGKYDGIYSIELVSEDLAANSNGTEFNIIVYSDADTEGEEYPYEATLESDVLETTCSKLSEKNYKCMIEYIEEGTYDMDFIVTEQGCPPCVFPLEITCTKKGKVSLREKTSAEGNGENRKNLKRPIAVEFEDGYFAAEVTDPDPNLHAGPGDSYPAPKYTIENMGAKEIPAPYKGQIIKVKDEGEWYLKYPGFPATQNPEPEYISKRSATPIKSQPFSLKLIGQPCIYASTHEIYNEANSKEQYLDQVMIYPGGQCVEYSEGKHGALLKFGKIADGHPAIEWRYRIQTSDGGDIPEGSKSKIDIDNSKSMHRLRLTVSPKDKRVQKDGTREISYLDLSDISSDEWIGVLKDYLLTADQQYDRHEVMPYECDILTKAQLEKNYIKITE